MGFLPPQRRWGNPRVQATIATAVAQKATCPTQWASLLSSHLERSSVRRVFCAMLCRTGSPLRFAGLPLKPGSSGFGALHSLSGAYVALFTSVQ